MSVLQTKIIKRKKIGGGILTISKEPPYYVLTFSGIKNKHHNRMFQSHHLKKTEHAFKSFVRGVKL